MRSGVGLFLLLVALAAIAGVGCGGSGDQTDTVGDIEVSGSSSEDLGIAIGLAEYINRGCKRNSHLNFAAFEARVAGNDSVSLSLRRYYLIRYGDLTVAYQSLLERCITYTSIDVADGEITVQTSLGHRLIDAVTADDTCRQIQSSDVADSTPGRVLDVQGGLLANCRRRPS